MVPPPTLATAPLAQVAAALRRRTVSPLELLEAYQRRIGPAAELRAFITPPGERARREAQRAQQQLARRQAGALLGVPIAVKDLFATRGLRTTAGSRILRDWVPSKDAGLVTRLRSPVRSSSARPTCTSLPMGSRPRIPGGGSRAIRAMCGAVREARVVDRPSRWWRASAPPRWARIPEDRSGSRLRSAAASG